MQKQKIMGTEIRKWFRIIHRHLSYVMTGMILVYGISGILLNHVTTWGNDAINLPVLSQLADLHYNPSNLWTYFSDIFVVCLLIITITGLFMMKGRKGMNGIGGIEFLLGAAIPIIIILLSV